MGTAVRFSSQFALKKRSKRNNNVDNQISQLPDGILATILYGLSMEEAARTSILSRRWRYLWTLFSASLELDGSETLFEIEWRGKSLEFERTRFVTWVNQVLRSHQGPSVDELKNLEIYHYCNLENLEISAENLVSFQICRPGLRTRFPFKRVPFKHVPSLAEVSLVEGDYSMHVMRNLRSFSSCLIMQHERLALFLKTNEAIFSKDIPILGNLKYLELSVSRYNRESLLSCMSLLDATPSLREFTMKVGPEGETSPSREFIAMLFKITRVTDYAAKKYEYVKVVKMVGCVGSIVVEFIACVLEHVVSLEKVVVNPRITGCRMSMSFREEPMYELARERSRNVVPVLLPPGGVWLNLSYISTQSLRKLLPLSVPLHPTDPIKKS
ncbi:hypothetical protein RHMOL_Rhmol01G0075600 [Rhododendron molle]|uniref:Uncharacterized protein n=1 Tax=Rhododendron molle TaxID=49168 RepID=A0ACC0Q1Z8_RHOML|nr:hypothetical protein RHMOL_Rhmol01G0075600 [Rhododendron molle]